ncbi:MAG: TetR/AcrR family transcriptional regulator [Proteobacteria bacterium]|nr:TetR/AcrR family transcriptional regulator [Pseudomonadota bacterium]
MLTADATPRRGRGRPPADESVVLQAALQLVQAKDPINITMEEIARRAGITKITLYRRWPSKAALLAEALLYELRHTAPLDERAPPRDAIIDHVKAFARGLTGKLGILFERVIAQSLTDPDARLAFRDRYLALRRRAAIDIIRRGAADGSFHFSGSAEQRHDELYGALFYRFLFKVGSLDQKSAVGLVDDTLNGGRPRRLTRKG